MLTCIFNIFCIMKHKTLTFYFIGILLGFCSGYNFRSMRIQQQSRPERPYVPLYKYKGDKYSPTTLIKSHEYGYVPLDHIYGRKPNGLMFLLWQIVVIIGGYLTF